MRAAGALRCGSTAVCPAEVRAHVVLRPRVFGPVQYPARVRVRPLVCGLKRGVCGRGQTLKTASGVGTLNVGPLLNEPLLSTSCVQAPWDLRVPGEHVVGGPRGAVESGGLHQGAGACGCPQTQRRAGQLRAEGAARGPSWAGAGLEVDLRRCEASARPALNVVEVPRVRGPPGAGGDVPRTVRPAGRGRHHVVLDK